MYERPTIGLPSAPPAAQTPILCAASFEGPHSKHWCSRELRARKQPAATHRDACRGRPVGTLYQVDRRTPPHAKIGQHVSTMHSGQVAALETGSTFKYFNRILDVVRESTSASRPQPRLPTLVISLSTPPGIRLRVRRTHRVPPPLRQPRCPRSLRDQIPDPLHAITCECRDAHRIAAPPYYQHRHSLSRTPTRT
jgi:hypothetical protein